jgi:hypothetical protein
MAALDYFLKKVYEHGSTGIEGYRAHLQAINAAFDLHPDYLTACVQRAEDTVIHAAPYCWKHVDQAHGVLLESVPANTPLMTHKPVLVMRTAHDHPEFCFFAQAFYMAMIQWTDESVLHLTGHFPVPFLKQVEGIETYTTVASLCMTWADWILNLRRSDEQWERRFWLFGVLSTRCLPCSHGCGRVMVMGPDYFDQVDEPVKPNAAVTIKAWSHPFGSIDETWATCTAHHILPVTYSHVPIAAGEFIKICMNDPVCTEKHPMQLKQENGHEYARVLLKIANKNMSASEITDKLARVTEVMEEHNLIYHKTAPVSADWPCRISSITMATASSLVNILQYADLSLPSVQHTIRVIGDFIKNMDLPHDSWYHAMLQDLLSPRFAAPAYQLWREVLKSKLADPNAEALCQRLLHHI